MLLHFYISKYPCLMDVHPVREVIPAIPVQASESAVGLIHYKGYDVPVVDLALAFLGEASKTFLSTRYIICEQPGGIYLALMVEKMTDFYDTMYFDYIRIEQIPKEDPIFLSVGYKIYLNQKPYYYLPYNKIVELLPLQEYLVLEPVADMNDKMITNCVYG